MIRWMTILVVSLFYLSPAWASLDRKAPPAANKLIPIKALSSAAEKNDDFRITAQTEVLLDGRPCRYEQVPEGALIVLLETVSNESKEIARIHFRSQRRPSSSTSK